MMNRIVLSVMFTALCLAGCKSDPMAVMPAFNLLLRDSTTVFNTENIEPGAPTVLIHFEADCRDCQLETDSLLMRMENLKDVRFYFATIGKFDEVEAFDEHFKLYNYPNITIGQDYEKFIPKHFKSHRTPLIAIYSKRNELIGVYTGKPNIEVLLKQIIAVK